MSWGAAGPPSYPCGQELSLVQTHGRAAPALLRVLVLVNVSPALSCCYLASVCGFGI